MKHPLYRTWTDMRARCLSPKCKAFKYYGKRGIRICARWDSFPNFLSDMGPTWKRGLWLDRKDNNGNYEPDNCAWKTPKQQGRNRRDNLLITICGVTKCVSEWCEYLGISHNTVCWKQWHKKMPALSAIATTFCKKLFPQRHGTMVEVDGYKNTIAGWCRTWGISRNAVYSRTKTGMLPQVALLQVRSQTTSV